MSLTDLHKWLIQKNLEIIHLFIVSSLPIGKENYTRSGQEASIFLRKYPLFSRIRPGFIGCPAPAVAIHNDKKDANFRRRAPDLSAAVGFLSYTDYGSRPGGVLRCWNFLRVRQWFPKTSSKIKGENLRMGRAGKTSSLQLKLFPSISNLQ